MAKTVALSKRRADVAAFDERYCNGHVELVNRSPDLQKCEVATVLGTPAGKSEYYLIAEMCSESRDTVKAGMVFAEEKAAARDTMSFAKDISCMMSAAEELAVVTTK